MDVRVTRLWQLREKFPVAPCLPPRCALSPTRANFFSDGRNVIWTEYRRRTRVAFRCRREPNPSQQPFGRYKPRQAFREACVDRFSRRLYVDGRQKSKCSKRVPARLFKTVAKIFSTFLRNIRSRAYSLNGNWIAPKRTFAKIIILRRKTRRMVVLFLYHDRAPYYHNVVVFRPSNRNSTRLFFAVYWDGGGQGFVRNHVYSLRKLSRFFVYRVLSIRLL